MTERKFDVAGLSTYAGKRKVRFANGKPEVRAKVLERNGHTDIDLQVLPNPMTKAEAMAWIGVKETDEAAPKGVQAKAIKASKLKELKVKNADSVKAPKAPAEDPVAA